jgi:hypothetical protein
VSRLQDLERRVDQMLRGLVRSSAPEQRQELIEVHRAIVEEVASRVESLPRGRVSFGYSLVKVQILAEAERRRSFEKVFVEGAPLEHDIKSYFDDRPVEYPVDLKVKVELVDDLPPGVKARGFDVSYSNAAITPVSAEPIRIRLTILVGVAEQREYFFRKQRINIGRLSEVLDGQLRPTRRNDVAIRDEAAGVNASVSRAHAHLEFDVEASRFRLFDDGSAQGTTLRRDGLLSPTPKGASKGLLLLPGDEIIVGLVHIGFEYVEAESQS